MDKTPAAHPPVWVAPAFQTASLELEGHADSGGAPTFNLPWGFLDTPFGNPQCGPCNV